MNVMKASPWMLAALLAGALAPSTASARVYTVGGDFACDFHSLQAALDAAAARPGRDIIRVARNLPQPTGSLLVRGDDVSLVGGFADCRRERPLGFTRLGRDGDRVRLVREGLVEVTVSRITSGPTGVEVIAEAVAVAPAAVER